MSRYYGTVRYSTHFEEGAIKLKTGYPLVPQDHGMVSALRTLSKHYVRTIIIIITSNGNRTEWSLIRSVMIGVMTKSDERAAGVRFVYHEYDYKSNWTTRSLITN